jgi:tetratricopeptide (TPR) repeat protein
MAGNKQIFDAAMRRGQEFASNKEWDKAMREYMRAAAEFPNDINMRSNLAEALFRMGRDQEALDVYQGLIKYNPNNTNALQRSGEILARQGKTSEAIASFNRLKEIFLKNNQQAQMIETLQQIVKVDPSRSEAYREIINTAKARGDRRLAATTALAYAQFCSSAGAYKDAASWVDEALTLQPELTEATRLKAELNGLLGNQSPKNQPESYNPATTNLVDARQDTINSLLADAEMALNNGDSGKALQQYIMAIESGAEGSELYYTVGGLYAQQNNLELANKYLRMAAEDSDYAASAFFALGQMYDQAEDIEQAVSAYESALSQIDTQQIGQDEIDELIMMYEPLGEDYLKLEQEEKAAELYNRLRDLIQNKKLRTDKTAEVLIKAREINEKVQEKEAALNNAPTPLPTASIQFGAGAVTPITNNGGPVEDEFATLVQDMQGGGGDGIGNFAGVNGKNGYSSNGATAVAAPPAPAFPLLFPTKLVQMDQNPQTVPWIRASEDFINRGLYMAAIDACQEVIHYFPNYVPAQVILAEIYVGQNRLEQARTKYQFVVDLYQIRNEQLKAIEAYRRLSEISPDNMALRNKLVNLMLQYGMKEDAAEISLGMIQSYVRSGQLERALEECRKLRSQAPQSASIRLQYAELLIKLERYAEALPELRRALEIEPANLRALCLLNITLFLSNEGEVKWTSFRTVIDRSHENVQTQSQVMEEYRQSALAYDQAGLHYALGCLYLESKQPAVALRSFEVTVKKAEEMPGNDALLDYELLARWQLGRHYLEINRHEEAVNELSKVVNLVDRADPQRFGALSDEYGGLPSQAQLYRKMAQAYTATNKIEFASKALRKVKQLLPYDKEVYFELADLNFQQGNLNEALVELGELAAHYEQQGKSDDMIGVLKRMVELAPNKIEVHDKLSQVYLQKGLIPDGLQELDELAQLQYKNGRVKDAVRTYQKAAEINWMMGQQSKSYEIYDRIVRISPGDVEARQQLVNLHIMAGRVKDAANEQRAIAQICLQNNQTQEAIAALHQVIMLAPEDTRAYFQLAQVLTGAGEFGQSYKLYTRILRLEPGNEKAQRLLTQVKQKGIEAGQIKPD